MHQERIQAVLANLEKQGCHQAVVSDPTSIFYLTGYYTEPYERFLALYVSPKECVPRLSAPRSSCTTIRKIRFRH